LKVLLYNEDEHFEQWNAYVKDHQDGELFHLGQWSGVIEKYYDAKNFSLIAINQNKVTGIFPLFLIDSIIYGKVLVTNPLAGYCGICADNLQIKEQIQDKAIQIAEDNKVHYLEFREYKLLDHQSLSLNKEHCTLDISLEYSADDLFKTFSKEKRNRIRNALDKKLTVEFSNNHVKEFYRIYSSNLKNIGGFAYSYTFFMDILEMFGDIAKVVAVKCDDKIIAGKIVFVYKSKLYNMWAGVSSKFRKFSPGNLLDWEIMKYCIQVGIKHFDFGRSQYGTGVFDYKKRWGANVKQLYYHYYLNKSKSYPSINNSKQKYKIPLAIWKELPLRMTNTLGPLIIKQIPL